VQGTRLGSEQDRLLPPNSPQPATPATDAAREGNHCAAGKDHLRWLSVSGGESKMDD